MASNNIWKKLTVRQYQLLSNLTHLEGWEYMRSVVAIVENNGFDAVDNYTPIELRNRYEAIAKYDGKLHAKRAKDVQEKMLAVEALGLSAFFLGSWLRLLEDLPTYLDKHLKELTKEMEDLTSARDLPNATDGSL